MGLKVVAIGHTRGLVKEADAYEAITPGHFVELRSDAKVQKNSVASTSNQPLKVALENDIFGKGLDDAYAAGDRVKYYMPLSGDEVQALVAAAAPAITYRDMVALATDGTVAKTTTRANAIGIALATVDNSAGASAVRLRIELF